MARARCPTRPIRIGSEYFESVFAKPPAAPAGHAFYHASKALPTVQPRKPVHASEAANPVMTRSTDQMGFDSTATDASIGCCTIFDRTIASASGNVVLTIPASELSVPLIFRSCPFSRRNF
jgi:hypothetical protein